MAAFSEGRGHLLVSLTKLFAHSQARNSNEPIDYESAIQLTLDNSVFDSAEDRQKMARFLQKKISEEGTRIANWQPRPFKKKPDSRHSSSPRRGQKKYPFVYDVDRVRRRVRIEIRNGVYIDFQTIKPGRSGWEDLQEQIFCEEGHYDLFRDYEIHRDPKYREGKRKALAILNS